jgi:putative oxidoreductase
MKDIISCTCGDTWRDHGHALLRVVTGLAFFYHGYDKVFTKGVAAVVPMFQSLGIPFAEVATYLVAYGELLGGLALMLGLFTHWVAKLDVVIMLGAIGFVHWGAEGGWFFGYGADGGYEYQLLLLAASVFFLVSGPGRFSLDAKRAQKMQGSSM